MRLSIHRDSWLTEAKAIASSLAGNSLPVSSLRIKRLPLGWSFTIPGRLGFHCVAGASVASSAILRGPVRRSKSGAICIRQLLAACARSAGVICNCTSFSASAKVAVETSGPTAGLVPKAGGAPGGN